MARWSNWKPAAVQYWRLLAELIAGLGFGQALGHDRVRCRVERHSDMCARDFDVDIGVHRPAIAPIDDSVLARVDGSFEHCPGNLAAERVEKIAGTAAGVAIRQHSAAMLLQDFEAHGLSGMEDRSIRYRSANRRRECDHRRHILGTLPCRGARYYASEAVADQVNLASSFCQSFVDRLAEAALDQQVRTLRIDTDARKIRAVSDTPQPCVEFRQVEVGAEKTGDYDDRRTVAARDAKPVVDRGRVQKKNFSTEKSFCPKRSVGFRICPRNRLAPCAV